LGVAERMPVHPDLQGAADRNEVLAAELVTSWGHARRGQVGGHPAPGLWMAGGAVRLIDRAPDGVLAADLAACNAYDKARERAATVRCPTCSVGLPTATPPSKLPSSRHRRARFRCPAPAMMMTERPVGVTPRLGRLAGREGPDLPVRPGTFAEIEKRRCLVPSITVGFGCDGLDLDRAASSFRHCASSMSRPFKLAP
jgi:hypothetical protein